MKVDSVNSFGRASPTGSEAVGAGSAGDGAAVLEATAVIRVVGTADGAAAVGVTATLDTASTDGLEFAAVGEAEGVDEATAEGVAGELAPEEAAGAATEETAGAGAEPEPDPPHDATAPPGAL